jgi:hypothetical protein
VKNAALAAVVAVVASGCLGNSSANGPPSTASRTGSGASRGAAVLDPGTRARLLAEYRAGRVRNRCPKGSLCPAPYPGVFWKGPLLVEEMNRANPSILATRNLNGTMSLESRLVFVLPDSNSRRLDIATAAADGRYVHLIAVGRHPPEFRFGAL